MTGEIWRTTKRLREQIRPPQGPVLRADRPANASLAALSLFFIPPRQNLAWDIASLLGIRPAPPQATILRLRGAVLFSRGESGAGAGIWTRPRG